MKVASRRLQNHSIIHRSLEAFAPPQRPLSRLFFLREEAVENMALAYILAAAALVLAAAGPAAAQPTNALPGKPPVVFNGGVLPDRTFVESTFLQVATGSAARQSYNDFDLYNFLTNTECLEASFDSWAAFGVPLDPALVAGGPDPIGANRANISPELLPFAQETARDEAGHVRLIREAIADLASPCPLLNFTAFADYFGNAVTHKFGKKYAGPPFFDPYFDDVTIFLAIWSLEEIGATGDKGITVLMENATMRDGAAGLAVSAGYQAAAQRWILWERRNRLVEPFKLTVAQVVEAISEYRDSLDGPQDDDQPLFYRGGINIVPTDANGVTYSRTPQQVLSILTFGAEDGKGGFFPNGVNGRINLPTPLGPVYRSTRPGTVYPAYDQTGFADPNTVDERFDEIPFLPGTPFNSEPPAPDVGIPPEAKFDEYLREKRAPTVPKLPFGTEGASAPTVPKLPFGPSPGPSPERKKEEKKEERKEGRKEERKEKKDEKKEKDYKP
ncbi:hypothetical protein KFL_000550140 [Klebsormidium nitens]|uniref:Desiccation-related protein PCC13-62 n=1 Tax=Klebsormidium nitens TaxID=105231 RepID=A0A1Y1HQX3_KLENI|nr:hypothetical protein KFL_000550140 [Klebsormidium nitens]|eukprot:GAQ80483.1 hypothetical protein KFL_000550140 [Klebsormidium nitens]